MIILTFHQKQISFSIFIKGLEKFHSIELKDKLC